MLATYCYLIQFLLCDVARQVQDKIASIMAAKNINLLLNTRVVDCHQRPSSAPNANPVSDSDSGLKRGNVLVAESGAPTPIHIPFDECFWCTQAQAQPWIRQTTSLETTEEGGFICVGPTLESVNVADVFACGDIAHLTQTPRPKAGVFAVRAGYV